LPVARWEIAESLEIAPAARGDAARVGSALGDLAGAAARLVSSPPTVNLLPARLRRQAGIRRRRAWLMAAAAIATLAPLPVIFHYQALADTARAKTAAIESAIAPIRLRETRNRAALAELAMLREQAAQLHDVELRRTAWQGLLADLQDRLVRVEDVWFERLQTIPPTEGRPLKLALSGRMLDKTNPLAKVSPETYARVQSLLEGLAASPYVAAVESERFDNSQPGILKFDFVLVTDAARPL
jgi:type IV pilus assembly protein PilM